MKNRDEMWQIVLTFSHEYPHVISGVFADFLPQVLDYCLSWLDLRSEGLHVRVPVLPHGGPDLPAVDESHVLVEVRLSDVLADRGEQVDECLQQVVASNRCLSCEVSS